MGFELFNFTKVGPVLRYPYGLLDWEIFCIIQVSCLTSLFSHREVEKILAEAGLDKGRVVHGQGARVPYHAYPQELHDLLLNLLLLPISRKGLRCRPSTAYLDSCCDKRERSYQVRDIMREGPLRLYSS